MEKFSVGASLAIAACLLLAQFIRIPRANPPSKGDLMAPPEIKALLRRACYDCHSNETRWPWYTDIAPVSWVIAREVERGRKQLNFSEWRSYYPATQRRKLLWINRTLHEDTMPPWTYRLLHPGAGLMQQELVELQQWIEAEIANQSEKTSK
jgi:hypothetical protein